MSASVLINHKGCLFMLRKNTQRSWRKKGLEGVDKYQILTTRKEHGISLKS